MKRIASVAVLVSAAALAGCSSDTTSSTTSTTGAHPAGLGATVESWDATHAAGENGPGYGPSVTRLGKTVNQYSSMQKQGDRFVGWSMAFPAGTKLASAEATVRKVLPSDAKQTQSWRGTFTGASGYCEFVNLQSASLADELSQDAPTGSQANIGLEFYEATANGGAANSIAVVNTANVRDTGFALGDPC